MCRWWKLTKICRALARLWRRLRRLPKLHSLRSRSLRRLSSSGMTPPKRRGNLERTKEDDDVFPTPSIPNAGSLDEQGALSIRVQGEDDGKRIIVEELVVRKDEFGRGIFGLWRFLCSSCYILYYRLAFSYFLITIMFLFSTAHAYE